MGSLIVFADQWVAAVAVLAGLIAAAYGIGRGNLLTGRAGAIAFWLLVAGVLVTIILPVFGYWFGGRTHANAIGGLLPWNDAAGYFNCARALTDGGSLDSFCQRRPHYSAYLTGLFALAGGKLQLALLLQVGLVAISAFFFARLLARRWGLAAALVALAPVAAFAGEFSITTLTENLGLALGLIAVMFLLAGSESRRATTLATGAFLLAVAINARAGAFFVLPFLVLWPLVLTDMSRNRRLQLAATILVSVAAGFVVGPALSTLLGGDPNATHANFSYTIYGIAAGGKGWLHVYQVHPELVLKTLSEAERAANVYGATWDLFRTQPDLMLQGLIKGFLKYLERILKYIPWLPVRIIVVLCWLTGIVSIIRRRRQPEASLLGLMALGIALSAPILAFDAGTRIYAATISVDAAIAAMGVFAILSWVAKRRGQPADPAPGAWTQTHFVAKAFTLAMVLLVFALPVAIRSGADPIRHQASGPGLCETGDTPSFARLGRESPVLPIVPASNQQAWPVAAAADIFTTRIDRYTYGSLGFAKATAGMSYISVYDLSDDRFGQTFIAISETSHVPADGRVYLVCTADWPDGPLDGVRRITRLAPREG